MKKKPTGKKRAVKKPKRKKTTQVLSATKTDDDTYEVLSKYEDEEEDLNKELAHEYEILVSTGQTFLEQALRVGALLNHLKIGYGRGEWLDYLAEHQPQISERVSQHCMDFDRHRDLLQPLIDKGIKNEIRFGFVDAVKVVRDTRTHKKKLKASKKVVTYMKAIVKYLHEEEEKARVDPEHVKVVVMERVEKEEKIEKRHEVQRRRDQQFTYLFKALKVTETKIIEEVCRFYIQEKLYGGIDFLPKKKQREARALMSKSIEEDARRADALASGEEERRSDPDWFIDEDYREARMRLAEARRRKADRAGKPTLKRKAKKSTRKKRQYGGFLSTEKGKSDGEANE